MKLYIILGATLFVFLVGGALGYYWSQHSIPGIVRGQQDTDKKQCEKDQQITKDANDALQKNRDAVAGQLYFYKLQHPTACVRVASRADIPSGGTKHAATDGNGISSDWLRAFAAQGETYRGEVSICADFMAKERDIIQPAE